MKAIGVIKEVEVVSKATKIDKQGHAYESERVVVYFESGDDTHMVQVFNSVYDGSTSEEQLRRRNLFVGARGEMMIHYGFRDWQGKRFSDVSMMQWHCDNVSAKEPEPHEQPATEQPQPAPAQQPKPEVVEVGDESKLPY